MRLKVALTSHAVLFLISILLLVACSDKKDAEVTNFPLVSPARFDNIDTSTLLVTDYGNQAILLVDKQSLASFRSISVNGPPTGVAYTAYKGGRYFVGNGSMGSVDIYDAQGEFIGYLGGAKDLFGQVNDLAINEADEFVYVLDSKTSTISVYDFEGNLFSSDFTAEVLIRPTAILFGSDGLIYVSEFGPPATIRVLDDVGGFTGIISGSTVGFSMPQGLHVDNVGNLFIVESRTGEVRVLDATHAFVKSVGSRGTDVGELFYPLDVYVDPDTKDVFVTDNQNGRITVYRGEGVVP